MGNVRGKRQRVLSWVASAGMMLAPAALAHAAMAQQQDDSAQQAPAAAGQQAGPPPAQTTGQPGQQGDWGPAGPPPDAQNGQVPPPPPPNYQGPDENQNQSPNPGQDQGPQGAYPGQDQGQYQGQYPGQDQGQYQEQYPGQYQDQAGQAPAPPPSGPVTIERGTFLQVRTSEPLDTKRLHPGDYFHATVAQSVFRGSVLVIPRGAEVVGRVVDVKKPGDLAGSAGLTLQLTSLNLGGQSFALATDPWSMNGPGKGGYTAANTVGSAVLGAAIGAIAGGGPGAAIGAAAGTGVGLGASAATPGPRGVIPPEALLSFRLAQPATVQPVSFQEAREMERSAPPQPGNSGAYRYPPPGAAGYYPGPYAAPYPYPYPYAAYPYPYPYVYAYPYGGYYRYWRR